MLFYLSHVIATAQVNGQLESYLTEINTMCKPNFTSIASQGMPNGTGRKGGKPKQKRNWKLPTIKTRSVRPCLEFSPHPGAQTMGSTSSSYVVNTPIINVLHSSQNQIAVGTSILCHQLLPTLSLILLRFHQVTLHSALQIL